MKVLYDIQDMIEDELISICKKGSMSQTDLDNVDKMVDIVKDISTIEAMREAGYSEDVKRYSGDWPMDYHEGSYRRGRDNMGRYTSRDGYSRHDSKESMIEGLRREMDGARSEAERENIRRVIDQLQH